MGTFFLFTLWPYLLLLSLDQKWPLSQATYFFCEKLLLTADLFLLYKILGSRKKSFRVKKTGQIIRWVI